MQDDQLEVVLPEKAELAELPGRLLAPGENALPGLWESGGPTLGEVIAYFKGGHTVTVPREGYDEVEAVPQCDEALVRKAVGAAAEAGLVWLDERAYLPLE